MDAALEPWSPKALYARLGGKVGEVEGVVRAVEGSFLEGGGEVSEREVGEWVRRVREGNRRLEGLREGRRRWDEGRVGGWR